LEELLNASKKIGHLGLMVGLKELRSLNYKCSDDC
jgi:hypothetical protein